MYRNLLTAGVASAAALVATPLFAQAHGGSAGMHSQGPANASAMGIAHANANSVLSNAPMTTSTGSNATTSFSTNSRALMNSQGPAHASANGISHANQNSVLARGSVSAGSLTGLTTGLSVNNSSGTSIGTVSQVVTGSDGSIRQVIVTSPTGQTYRLAPTTLSISGNVVTTTSTSVGG